MQDDGFRYLSRNFICLWAANFLYFGSFYLLLPTLSPYAAALGASTFQVGLVMGFFTFASVTIRPQCGVMAGTYGRRPVMLAGVGFFSLVFFLYAVVDDVYVLYAVRALHGLGHAAFLAAAAAYIADLAPVERRGEVIGYYSLSNIISMAVFPAVGVAWMKYSQDDFTGLVWGGGAIALVAWAFVAGLQECSTQESRRPGASLRQVAVRTEVWASSLALWSGALCYGVVITFLPLFAPARGIEDFGIFFSVYAVSTVVSRAVAGKLSDRIGRKKVIVPFMLVMAAAMIFLAQVTSVWELAVAGALFGFGLGAYFPVLNALVVDHTPLRDRGTALGFFTSFMDVGIASGAVVLGFAGEYLGYDAMFFWGAGILFLTVFVFANAVKSERK